MLTDLNVHTEPALPSLPAAGGTLVDPVFDTEILRVTDATTEPDTGGHKGVINAYSTQQSFNCTNTRVGFLVRASYTRFRVFAFDPVNFTINTTGALLASPPAGLQEYGMCWDNTNPDIIYGVGNYNLYSINWATGVSTTLRSFIDQGHSGGYVTQMNMSADNDVFAMRFEGGTGIGYVVWKRSTNTVLKKEAVLANLDEVEIDKSGRYLIIVYNGGSAEVWDLNGTPAKVADCTGNNGFNHRDCGSNGIFTHRPANTSLGYRTCASPLTITNLLPNNAWSYTNQQDHFSMQADDDGWALASRYHTSGGGVSAAFDNEICRIATDGSQRVQRICHHRSVFNEYYDSPFASISKDGQFVCFSSNWGNASGRHDGFIARIVQEAPPAGEIEHAYAQVTTDQTTSSNTFTGVTGASLASSNFTTGKKYLLFLTAQASYTFGDGTEMRVVHGATEFDGSKSWIDASSTGWRQTYPFLRVWTAVSGEDIALQFRSRAGGANVAYCNFASLLAMNLSDHVVENTDWFYSEVAADDVMSTTFEDGATITVGAGTWLVLGTVLTDSGAQITNYPTVRLTDGTNVFPQAQVDVGVSTRDEKKYGFGRVFTTAGSTTFKLQYKISASTTGTHLHSTIFAIKLTKFRTYASAFSDGPTALSATDWATQIQTLSITPDIQGDVWVGSYWTFDRNNSARMANQRLQIDNVDVPSGQTAAAYDYRAGIDGTDEDSLLMSTLVANMTAAAHTIDLDGSADSTTGTPEAESASLWAVTMQLSSVIVEATGSASSVASSSSVSAPAFAGSGVSGGIAAAVMVASAWVFAAGSAVATATPISIVTALTQGVGSSGASAVANASPSEIPASDGIASAASSVSGVGSARTSVVAASLGQASSSAEMTDAAAIGTDAIGAGGASASAVGASRTLGTVQSAGYAVASSVGQSRVAVMASSSSMTNVAVHMVIPVLTTALTDGVSTADGIAGTIIAVDGVSTGEASSLVVGDVNADRYGEGQSAGVSVARADSESRYPHARIIQGSWRRFIFTVRGAS